MVVIVAGLPGTGKTYFADKLADNIKAIRISSDRVRHDIKKLGLSLSIDDFGTGYSSLSYLKHLPIEELKIDRSFISDLPDNKNDAAIVRTIIALANGLEIDLIAEGVETERQIECLSENGCDSIQGFYYSKPLPAEKFKQYVLQHNAPVTS